MSAPGSTRDRYSRLAPLSFHERLRLSVLAIDFFAPRAYRDMCGLIGKVPAENRVEPFSGRDFLTYLEKAGKLPEPNRYLHRIRELLARLCAEHLLTDVGQGKDVLIGTHYYFMRELTALEKQSVLWLAPALGAEFILHMYSQATFQITGVNKSGDMRAGTGFLIAPQWLLTCAHVLNDMKVDEVQCFGGTQCKVLRALPHSTIDVGLVEITPSLPSLSGLAFRDPVVAEPAFTLGYPRIPLSQEPALVMHRGEITSPRIDTFSGQTLFLYSAIARPGNSGGPIIGENGHVVGIVTDELSEEISKVGMPFFAGVRTSEIVRAVAELESTVTVPTENYD